MSLSILKSLPQPPHSNSSSSSIRFSLSSSSRSAKARGVLPASFMPIGEPSGSSDPALKSIYVQSQGTFAVEPSATSITNSIITRKSSLKSLFPALQPPSSSSSYPSSHRTVRVRTLPHRRFKISSEDATAHAHLLPKRSTGPLVDLAVSPPTPPKRRRAELIAALALDDELDAREAEVVPLKSAMAAAADQGGGHGHWLEQSDESKWMGTWSRGRSMRGPGGGGGSVRVRGNRPTWI